MRIAIIGQQKFGKAVLEAFIERGDTVAGVFCAPEKPGAAADPLRVAAEQRRHSRCSSCLAQGRRGTQALREPRRSISASWPTYCSSCRRSSPPFRATARFSITPRCCRAIEVRARSTGRSFAATRAPGSPSFGRPMAWTRGRSSCRRRPRSGPTTRSAACTSSACFPMGIEALLEAADLVVERARGERGAG